MSDSARPDRHLEREISRLLGVKVAAAVPMQGGDLSAVYCIKLVDGRIAVAKSSPQASIEATMLRAIREAGASAPEVLASSERVLVMERLVEDGNVGSAWVDLAKTLVTLHGSLAVSFGWSADYAFGTVAIANDASADWPEFWAERRLLCHLPHIPAHMGQRVERLCLSLSDRLPQNPPPSLLHGDLWGGNVLVSGGAVTGLIDPACYYGDREVDAAMLTLFDRPPQRFFDMMNLEAGWRKRQPVYRLWSWLVHLRLFGDSYRPAVESCLTELGV